MTLKLVLKTRWYRMIESGKKKEEYREVTDYWMQRLCKAPYIRHNGEFKFREFDRVRFYLGYATDRPMMEFAFKGIAHDFGKPEWGADRQMYFVIKLGERL